MLTYNRVLSPAGTSYCSWAAYYSSRLTGQQLDHSSAATPLADTPRRCAILLAAGASTRMGRAKALLPWAGTTLVEYSLAQLRAAGASTIVVVLGAGAEDVRATLPSPDRFLILAVNEHYEEGGRSSSIRTGVVELPLKAHPILVQSVDQPSPAAVIQDLYEVVEKGRSSENVAIAMPTYQGRTGHPICLSGELRDELASVTEAEQGLRAILWRHSERIARLPVSSSAVLLNLNDPEAYAAAYAAHGEE